jgi:hypothetical protein
MRLPFAATLALVALVVTPNAFAGGPEMLVGATEDAAQQPSLALAKAQMDLAVLAGFNAVRLSERWDLGQTALAPDAAQRLANAVAAADLDNIHVIVSIYPRGSTQTPLTDGSRADFAAWAVSVVKAAPTVKEVIVGNEPNLNRFWLPQFSLDGGDAAATAFLPFLATTYDALKLTDPTLIVGGIGLSPRGGDNPNAPRKTHSPTAFLTDLGQAYRESGRQLPIMDELGFHPYEDASDVDPLAGTHPTTTTIALADYQKLVALLGAAFDGTAQPGSTLPILYDEFGVESQIPARKASLYSGKEPAFTHPVTEATQGDFYREGISLAFCQPTVKGILLFHVTDENVLGAWQSGVYYADGKPKRSIGAVRAAALDAHQGDIASCAGLKLTPKASVRVLSRINGNMSAVIRCNFTCDFRLRLERLPAGSATASLAGEAQGDTPLTVPMARLVHKGQYRFALIAWAHANRGSNIRVISPAFRVR